MTTQRSYYYCCYYRYCGDYYYDDDDDDDDLALSLLAPVMPCFSCWFLFTRQNDAHQERIFTSSAATAATVFAARREIERT